MDIKNKVTIITGASAGIGLATARQFAKAGAKVVLASRSVDKMTELADELRQQGCEVLAVPTDMRQQSDVNHLVEETIRRYGQIDILINNAGQAQAGTVAEFSLDDFRQILELNVFGVVYAIQAVVPRMRERGGGLIINISSMVSRMHIPGLGAYAATKAALNMLSDTARGELAADNIRVVTFYPRMTATDFGKNSLGNRQMRSQQRSGSGAPAMPPMDSAELVAERIIEAAQKEPAEQFMDS